MTARSIKTGEELTTFLEEQERSLERLDRAYADLIPLFKQAWKGGGAARVSPGAAKIGEFCRALIAKDYGRLQELGGKPEPVGDWQTKVLGTPLTSDAASGSYTVPVSFYGDVFKIVEEQSVLWSLAQHLPMKSRTLTIPVRNAITNMGWITAQGSAAIGEQSPTFNSKTLTAYTLAGYVPLNESLLEDNDVLLGQYLIQCFGEDFGTEIDNAIFNALTVPFSGIFVDGNVSVVTLGEGKTSLDSITADDLASIIAATPLKYRRGGQWFMPPEAFDVFRRLKNAMGDYILTNPISADPTGLFGYRVNQCDEITGTPAAGAKVIAFFNPKNVIIGDRVSLAVEIFNKTSYAVTSEELFVRGRARLGFCLPVPGAIITMKLASS